ncbi:hypothetical protein HAX54_021021, partial [Datura stramonium]|nr:hypothetical protein [Datura stramonium]
RTWSSSRSKSGYDTVPSSGQLESEEAYDRRRTADRPNHKTIPRVFKMVNGRETTQPLLCVIV